MFTKALILDIKFRFTCGESNLFNNFTKFQILRRGLSEWVAKKRRSKGLKANKKAVYKEIKDKSCLLTLDLKLIRSYVGGKHSPDRELQGIAV